jgi:hypothetical protein
VGHFFFFSLEIVLGPPIIITNILDLSKACFMPINSYSVLVDFGESMGNLFYSVLSSVLGGSSSYPFQLHEP